MRHEIHLQGEVGLRGTTRPEVPRYTTMVSAHGERSHAVLQGSSVSACGRDARAWVPLLHIGELLWHVENKRTSDDDASLDGAAAFLGVSSVTFTQGASDGPPPALEPTCKQCARRVGTWVPEDRLNRAGVMKLAHALYEERAEQAEGKWGEDILARTVFPRCPHCGWGLVWLSSDGQEIRYYCQNENRDVTLPQRGQETA